MKYKTKNVFDLQSVTAALSVEVTKLKHDSVVHWNIHVDLTKHGVLVVVGIQGRLKKARHSGKRGVAI